MEIKGKRITNWILALPGTILLVIIQIVLEKYFPTIWDQIIKFISRVSAVIGYSITINVWLILLIGIIFVLENIFIFALIKSQIGNNTKIKRTKSKDTDFLLKDFIAESTSYIFDINVYGRKISIFNQYELNEIFFEVMNLEIEKKNILSVLYFIINKSNILHKYLLSNVLFKKILLTENTYLISGYINNNEKHFIYLLTKVNKQQLWELVISVLKRLDYNTTNDIITGLANKIGYVPKRYEPELYLQLFNVSKSGSYKKDIAKSLFDNAQTRVYIKILDKITTDNFYSEYYDVYKNIKSKIGMEKKYRRKMLRIEKIIKDIDLVSDIPF